jgi:hypothetical protein
VSAERGAAPSRRAIYAATRSLKEFVGSTPAGTPFSSPRRVGARQSRGVRAQPSASGGERSPGGRPDAHIRRRLRGIIIRQRKRPRFLFRHLRSRGGSQGALDRRYCVGRDSLGLGRSDFVPWPQADLCRTTGSGVTQTKRACARCQRVRRRVARSPTSEFDSRSYATAECQRSAISPPW